MKTWQNLTHMLSDLDTMQEMKKKFYGTILGIIRKPNAAPYYCKYTGYNDNGQQHFMTCDGDKIVLNFDTESEVFIPDPPRGLYNTPSGTVMFSRLPYRQHKRGLYSETATITNLEAIVTRGFYANNLFDFHIYDVLADKKQIPNNIKYACERITDDVRSYAINREFAVMKSHIESKGFSLFYYNSYIGQVDPTNKEIRVDVPLFRQELMDYLRNEPLLWRVYDTN